MTTLVDKLSTTLRNDKVLFIKVLPHIRIVSLKDLNSATRLSKAAWMNWQKQLGVTNDTADILSYSLVQRDREPAKLWSKTMQHKRPSNQVPVSTSS
jgi:hypothetical protein